MKQSAIRWLKFNAVGAMGIAVQLMALALLKSGLRMDYLSATALAVEAAVIHNFIWHERFTWADREGESRLRRFAKFNLTTGMVSILGNLLLMKWMVAVLGIPYLAANAVSIAVCSVANFLVSDRAVFQAARSD